MTVSYPPFTVQPPNLTIRRKALASTPRNRQTIGVQRLIGRTWCSWYVFGAHKVSPGAVVLGLGSDD